MMWECVDTQVAGPEVTATFRLTDTEDSRRQWNHAFSAELAVTVGGNRLSLMLALVNTGSKPFDFTAALHTYLAVADITATTVEGLTSLQYRDATAGGREAVEDAPQIRFRGEEMSRIYRNAPAEVRVVEAGRTTVVRQAGFADTVVWNPGAARCAILADLEPDDYRRFVCIEAVTVGTPVRLGPGQRWQGTQMLAA